MIYLAAPAIDVAGSVRAEGGRGGPLGGPPAEMLGADGGAGGLGRIRISVLPPHCVLSGTLAPVLVDGCAETPAPGVAGKTFIGTYPD